MLRLVSFLNDSFDTTCQAWWTICLGSELILLDIATCMPLLQNHQLLSSLADSCLSVPGNVVNKLRFGCYPPVRTGSATQG
jgi:hypothetical protein